MRSRSSRYSALSGGILLIGIGVIFLLRLDFFPALLAVLGLSTILAGLATGRGWYGIQGGIWLIGLYFLFQFEILFPGILILIGISSLIAALTRPMLKGPVEGQQGEKPEK
jgi:hypothetical protein